MYLILRFGIYKIKIKNEDDDIVFEEVLLRFFR